MKNFINKYFKEILVVVLIVVVIFLLVKIFTPAPDKSELLKYKLKNKNNWTTQ
jgi:energy-converting hydrogenase Eha subunit H